MCTRGDRLRGNELNWSKIGNGGLTDAYGIKNRDEDGTIDRVVDPPAELLPVLYILKKHVQCYNLDLFDMFRDAGGNHFGTIPSNKFASCLVGQWHRLEVTVDLIDKIVRHYGTGQLAKGGGQRSDLVPQYDCVAWRCAPLNTTSHGPREASTTFSTTPTCDPGAH